MDTRSKLIRKNVIGSFIVKGWSGVIQLLLVPLTLDCINQYEYGIWMTIASILVWIDSFDIGLGNGLRNRLAEAVAKDDWVLSRKIVSTTFGMLILIISAAWILITGVSHFLNFYSILNVQMSQAPQLNSVLFISFSLICATFIFKFIGNIFLGLQMPAINNVLVTAGQTIILIGIFILSRLHSTTLVDVAVVYTLSPLIVYMVAYPITFRFKYRQLAPSLKFFDKSLIRNLFSMGIQFFIIQLSGIIIFFTVNLLISNYFTPKAVTPYQIVFRYFSLITLAFSIIMTPFWSATTDAYAKGDLLWINRAVRNINKMLLLAAVAIVVMVVASPLVYRLWIHGKVEIPFDMSLYMGIYAFIIVWSTSYSNLLNGLGFLRLQIYNTVVIAALFIPLSYVLCRHIGVSGMIITMCLINVSGAILNTIQFFKIINGKACGVWKK